MHKSNKGDITWVSVIMVVFNGYRNRYNGVKVIVLTRETMNVSTMAVIHYFP